MTDNDAILAGYTKQIIVSAGMDDLDLLVKPDVDLDDRFRAWDMDAQGYIKVNGWMCTFEDYE